MDKAIIALLAIIAIDYAMDWHFDYAGDGASQGVAQQLPSPAPSYDVQGLNALVARLERPSLTDRQAQAYADVYGISQNDLRSKINIFGERN